MDSNFKHLTELLQKLPGVGPRQAARFVLSLLNRTQTELEQLGTAITELKQSIRFCAECFNISDDHLCHICTDSRRDAAKLMVLEKVTDLASVERTGLYRGLYHVLGGAIDPVAGIGPEHLRIGELHARIAGMSKNSKDLEIILAMNPTASGDATMMYLRETLKDRKNLATTRLGRGLSSGSNLEYADEMTLRHALEHRK